MSVRSFTAGVGLWDEPPNNSGQGGYIYSPHLEGGGDGNRTDNVLNQQFDPSPAPVFTQKELQTLISFLKSSGNAESAQYYQAILDDMQRGALIAGRGPVVTRCVFAKVPLANIDIDLTEQEAGVIAKVKRIADHFNIRVFLAGGFLRDKLLGRPVNDMDMITDRDIYKLTAALVKAYKLEKPVIGDRSKAVMLTIDRMPVDLMNARKLYSPMVDLEGEEELNAIAYNDSFRRDLTINSMLYDLTAERLIDFHKGREDLKKKVIRTVFDPYIKYRTAPLDMLRAIRFAAILPGFRLHPAVANAIREHAPLLRQRNEGGDISNRRTRSELRKAITTEEATRKALDLLIETNLFPYIESDIKYVLSDRGFNHLLEDAQLEVIKNQALQATAQTFQTPMDPTGSGGPGGQFTVPNSEGAAGPQATSTGGYFDILTQRKTDRKKKELEEKKRKEKRESIKELLREFEIV